MLSQSARASELCPLRSDFPVAARRLPCVRWRRLSPRHGRTYKVKLPKCETALEAVGFLDDFWNFLQKHPVMIENHFGCDQATNPAKSISEVAGMSGILCIRNLGFGGFG